MPKKTHAPIGIIVNIEEATMPTLIAEQLFGILASVRSTQIERFDAFEFPFEWPGTTDCRLKPKADISGWLRGGERFIVEIDDHTDPSRSIIKYWPLLHAMACDGFDHPPIALAVVSKPNSAYGIGFHKLAEFIGCRLTKLHINRFRFKLIYLNVDNLNHVADNIVEFFEQAGGSFMRRNCHRISSTNHS